MILILMLLCYRIIGDRRTPSNWLDGRLSFQKNPLSQGFKCQGDAGGEEGQLQVAPLEMSKAGDNIQSGEPDVDGLYSCPCVRGSD